MDPALEPSAATSAADAAAAAAHEALRSQVALYSSNPYARHASQPLAVCRSWLAYAHPLQLKLFYHNTVSKKSQWHPPEEWDHELSVMPPLTVLVGASGRRWFVLRDIEYLLQYFVDGVTGRSQWRPPEDIRAAVVEGEGAAVDWDAAQPSPEGEEAEGQRESTLGNAALVIAKLRLHGMPWMRALTGKPAGPALGHAGPWNIYISLQPDTTGLLYYFNPATKLTQWDVPLDLLQLPDSEWGPDSLKTPRPEAAKAAAAAAAAAAATAPAAAAAAAAAAPAAAAAGTATAAASSGPLSKASEWNAAGNTVEEKDLSSWARARLKELLRARAAELVLPLPGVGRLEVTGITGWAGSTAGILISRGKTRYILDMEPSLGVLVELVADADVAAAAAGDGGGDASQPLLLTPSLALRDEGDDGEEALHRAGAAADGAAAAAAAGGSEPPTKRAKQPRAIVRFPDVTSDASAAALEARVEWGKPAIKSSQRDMVAAALHNGGLVDALRRVVQALVDEFKTK